MGRLWCRSASASSFGLGSPILARLRVQRGAMAKQGSTQSRGSGVAGAEFVDEQELGRSSDPLLAMLVGGALDAVLAAGDAIGQALCSGSIAAEDVGVLSEAEEALDSAGRVLEAADAVVRGSGA